MKRSALYLAAALGATALNVVLYAAWRDAAGYAAGLAGRFQLVQTALGEANDRLAATVPDHPPATLFERHDFLPVVEDPALEVSGG